MKLAGKVPIAVKISMTVPQTHARMVQYAMTFSRALNAIALIHGLETPVRRTLTNVYRISVLMTENVRTSWGLLSAFVRKTFVVRHAN